MKVWAGLCSYLFQLLMAPRVPWLMVAALLSLPPFPHPCLSSMCLSPNFPLLPRPPILMN